MWQKLWTLALVLAWLKIRLNLFYGWTDRDETLESQEGNLLNFMSSINHTTEPPPPEGVSGSSFLHDPAKTHFSLTTGSHSRFHKKTEPEA